MSHLALVIASAVTIIAGSPRLQSKADPLTDVVQTLAAVSSQDSHLAVVCDPPRQLTVNIAGEKYLGNVGAGILAGGAQVTYRFDQGEPYTTRASLNGRSMVLAPGENIPFMLRMRGASSLYLRVIGTDGNPVDFQISFSSFDAMLDQVFTACGHGPDGKKLKKR